MWLTSSQLWFLAIAIGLAAAVAFGSSGAAVDYHATTARVSFAAGMVGFAVLVSQCLSNLRADRLARERTDQMWRR